MSESKELVLGESHAVSSSEMTPLLRLALEQKVDVGVLERLMDLEERVSARNARAAFMEALTAFRQECPPIKKTRENTQFRVTRSGVQRASRYAPLEEIDATARPVAHAHGLTWKWNQRVEGEMMHVDCILFHVAGHHEVSSVTVPVESKSGASPQQKYGAAQTYGMRYSLMSALGLTSADEDVDGQAPKGSGEKISEEQIADLKALMDEVLGKDEKRERRFYAWLKEATGAELLMDLPASEYAAVVAKLEGARR